MYFQFGQVMHSALEAYHDPELSNDREAGQVYVARADAARVVFQAHWEAATAKAQKELGFLWSYAVDEWDAHEKLGKTMLEGYFRADVMANTDIGKVLATERRFRVRIPGTNGYLTGQLDLLTDVGPRGREEKRAWDHKNLSSQHNSSLLDQDDQLSGYAWIHREVTGETLDSVAYNVLLKKLPVSEKTGKPTKSQLFVRDVTYRSNKQLDEFGRNLAKEWEDMKRVAANPDEAYPNPSQFNCPGCPVRQICVAMMQGEDYEHLIKTGFVIGDERD